MSYGPSSHRATSDGSLALLVKPLLARPGQETGQHRQPAGRSREPGSASQCREPGEPHHAMQMVMSGLAMVIMLAIGCLSGFFIIADLRRGHDAEAAGTTPPLGDRVIDPTPLRLEEVFPGTEIRLVPGAAPYLIGMTHIDTDCDIAATGELGSVLKDHACNQVVRASLTAPYGGYQVTAGIFNLADEADAVQVGELAGRLVESGDGTFAAMSAGGSGTDPLHRPLAQVGWHDRGHYLIYCVIVRPDGQVVRDDDPYARRITVDLVQSYLGDQVIGNRSAAPQPPAP
jgi:hypothetical protein